MHWLFLNILLKTGALQGENLQVKQKIKQSIRIAYLKK